MHKVAAAGCAIGSRAEQLLAAGYPFCFGGAIGVAACCSIVTWLMVRARNTWDCVAAHAVTNLLLGFYVVTQGQWQLW